MSTVGAVTALYGMSGPFISCSGVRSDVEAPDFTEARAVGPPRGLCSTRVRDTVLRAFLLGVMWVLAVTLVPKHAEVTWRHSACVLTSTP